MFLIFRNRAIDVWKEKLDWVAANGGLALLNVHPDYLAFDRQAHAVSEFPPAMYEGFLAYVKEKYAGAYWQPLPRELARYCRRNLPQPEATRPSSRPPFRSL